MMLSDSQRLSSVKMEKQNSYIASAGLALGGLSVKESGKPAACDKPVASARFL